MKYLSKKIIYILLITIIIIGTAFLSLLYIGNLKMEQELRSDANRALLIYLAYQYKDSKYCSELVSESSRTTCYYYVAQSYRDPEKCTELINETFQSRCKEEIKKILDAINSDNIELCILNDTRYTSLDWDCVNEFIVEKKNPGDCEKTEEINTSYHYSKEPCIIKLAALTGNVTLCEQLKSKYAIAECYAVTSKDSSKCTDTDTKEGCYYLIAILTKNKNLCNSISSSVGRRNRFECEIFVDNEILIETFLRVNN